MRKREDLEEEEEPEEEIILQRLKKRDLEKCMHCKRDSLGPQDLVLCIETSTTYMVLCERCENELLSRLLANWLRRRRRKGKGLSKTLPKLEDPGDDSDIEFADLWEEEELLSEAEKDKEKAA